MKTTIITSLLLYILIISNVQAQSTAGDQLFDDSFVHEIRVNFFTTSFFDTLESNYQKQLADISGQTRIYIPAQIQIDGLTLDTIGFREKGIKSNYSTETTKKPFKIDINEFVKGQKYDGLKKINLQNGYSDPSIMRDKLSYDILRRAGLKAPRSAYAKLYFNDTYWGLYLMVEQIDKVFVKQNFSSKAGNLYKCINNTSLSWLGNNADDYAIYLHKKNNKTENDWTDLIHFIDVINNTPIAEIEDSVDTYFNIGDFIKSMAIDVALCNWDSYFDNGRNFYIYRNPDDNKFHWIHWDYNTAFSSVKLSVFPQHNNPLFIDKKPLENCIYYNPNYRIKYLRAFNNLFADNFTSNRLNPLIDQLGSLIRPHISSETNSSYTISEFDEELNILKQFVFNRISVLTSESEALLEFEESRNLMISEIMVSNNQSITDENGEHESWVEIYNPTNTTIQLDGYYLTKTPVFPQKWNFPNIGIAPNSYKVIYADNEIAEGVLHSNFVLNSESDRIQLLQYKTDTLFLVNSVCFPNQIGEDKSYGRVFSDILNWTIFDIPTPNNQNSSIVSTNYNLESNLFDFINCYPNPFSASTTISFTLKKDTKTNISVFDTNGRLVKVIADRLFLKGENKITVNTSDWGSGVYFYNISSVNISQTKRIVLVR